jgi:crotonobetainyl-CoA:carnitine CoA-transferase CaiB-like acyl-CoA transferase
VADGADAPRSNHLDFRESSGALASADHPELPRIRRFYAPVLSPEEASRHPHMAARGTYLEIDKLLQAAPAPRFSRGNVAPGPVPERGADTASILASL